VAEHPITALQVTITAHRLGGGKEAYDVHIDAHAKVPTEWAVDMLRQIADGLEHEPLADVSSTGTHT
jgi:hypothetical protein